MEYVVVDEIAQGIWGFEDWKTFIEDNEKLCLNLFEWLFFGVKDLK